jgi:hypothetical protein
MVSPAMFSQARVIGAALLGLLLLYWTFERVRGGERDPVIRSSMSSDTGSASFLVSGTTAVAMVAGLVAALLLWPGQSGQPLLSPQPVLLGLGLVVVGHWFFEKEERET